MPKQHREDIEREREREKESAPVTRGRRHHRGCFDQQTKNRRLAAVAAADPPRKSTTEDVEYQADDKLGADAKPHVCGPRQPPSAARHRIIIIDHYSYHFHFSARPRDEPSEPPSKVQSCRAFTMQQTAKCSNKTSRRR
eukprot:11215834-Lingulodinium_polyedra.AAC.1